MIEVRGLSKRYGEKIAVNNLSFSVAPGKVTGFLGPNGAGKTTTMRLILGLDYPRRRDRRHSGKKYANLAYPMREVGALIDAKAVHGGRSAYNHLLCLAQTNNLPKRRVGEVLELVGLTEVARKRTKGFSLGMSQRLGIAGTLLGDPAVLMFDEPVNGLDPEGILWIRNLMRALAAEGRTVFVSSHLMSEMEHTADQLIVIGRGQLLADCTMEEFIARSSGQTVRVSTPQREQLAKAVAEAGGAVIPGGRRPDGIALTVSGLNATQVGDIAFEHGVRLHELTVVRASLEAAFMELTADSVEYRAAGDEPGQPPAPGQAAPASSPPRSSPRWGSTAAKGGSDMAVTTKQARPPVLPPPSGRAGFGGTLRSEFTKIRSVRSTYWTLLVLLAVSIGIGAAISAGTAASWSHTSASDRATFDATQASIAGLFYLGQLVIVVLGAMVFTAEYSTGMIRTSLTAMPRRVTVYAAKVAVFAVVALVVTLVAAFIAFFLGQSLLASTHESATLSQPNVLRAVVGSALYVTLCGLFAFAAGAIMRHTAAAITSVIGLLFVIPILAHLLPSSWYQDLDRWLPDAAGRAISATVGGQDPHLFSPWGQFSVFAVYTVILLVVGGVLFLRRDA